MIDFDWDLPDVCANFCFFGGFLSLYERKLLKKQRYEAIPLASFRTGRMPSGFGGPYDVAMIPISAPDAAGFCSFGMAVWFSPTVIDCARLCIGEIHEDAPRVGGARVHISRFHAVVKANAPLPNPPRVAPSPETERATEVICRMVATQLIADGDTLQTGVGSIPAGVVRHLHGKQDLGFHSELVPSAVASLVESGIITGRRK